MIYELRANLFTHDLSVLNDIRDKIEDGWSEMEVVNPGQPDQQCSEADLIQCRHDEHPPRPCTEIWHKDNCPIEP